MPVAFVTGGNGISGSAIVEHLAAHTDVSQWSRIVVTSRSAFQTDVHDVRIEFIALDFAQDPEVLAEEMRDVCKDVTHAFFSSYVHSDDFAELNRANEALFENFLDALVRVAPKLENCTLQTGGKYYGVHLGPVPTPCREDDPRRASVDNFYFPQEDFLASKQRGKRWTWNVVRPEAIIGHTSKPNGMNEALTCALYFMVCKELGEEARMPTNQRYWNGTETVSDASMLARFTIWVSSNGHCANQAFNFVNGDVFTWRYMWPRLALYFGARATPEQNFALPEPRIGEVQQELRLAEWAKDKRPVWSKICDGAGIPKAKASFDAGTFAFQDWVFMRSWTPNLSMNKARSYGWTGHVDSYESFIRAFAKLRELKQIP